MLDGSLHRQKRRDREQRAAAVDSLQTNSTIHSTHLHSLAPHSTPPSTLLAGLSMPTLCRAYTHWLRTGLFMPTLCRAYTHLPPHAPAPSIAVAHPRTRSHHLDGCLVITRSSPSAHRPWQTAHFLHQLSRLAVTWPPSSSRRRSLARGLTLLSLACSLANDPRIPKTTYLIPRRFPPRWPFRPRQPASQHRVLDVVLHIAVMRLATSSTTGCSRPAAHSDWHLAYFAGTRALWPDFVSLARSFAHRLQTDLLNS